MVEGELVDTGGGTLREVGHALAELVVGCELVALGDQSAMLVAERAVAGVAAQLVHTAVREIAADCQIGHVYDFHTSESALSD